VETEAYSALGDDACHTFSRPSTREFVARNIPGTAYVYLNYGMYWLFNVLVKGGRGGADEGFVLIRALEPTHGIEVMEERRGQHSLHALCSGPGKLTQAFGITGAAHGLDLCGGALGFCRRIGPMEVETDVRVGINRSAHLLWRFLLKGSSFVSVPRKSFAPDPSPR
jgi:DNA-3-methyladenine glycosylase